MTDRILKALGATDELDALRIIAESSQYLADVNTATGRETFAGSLEVMQQSIALAREVANITDKPGQESIGVLMAWKSSHERLPAVEAEKSALDEKVRVQDVASLIRAGLETPRPGANEYAGKLTPATAKFWESKSATELQAFLAIAPRVIPGTVAQVPASAHPAIFAPNSAGRIANGEDKTYEQLLPAARSDLKKNDRALYDAMRDDWTRAGKPAGLVDSN